MFKLIMINIEKRLTFLSILFILISAIIIYTIGFYQASFNNSFFVILNEYELVLQNYLVESVQVIEVVGVLFVILLVASELFYNINNFDAYFISYCGKLYFFITKIIGYIIIIFFYLVILFAGLALIYIIRFENIIELNFIFDMFSFYFVFFTFLYLFTHLTLILFNNYFASLMVFIFYWISKIIENSFIDRYVFLNLAIDFNNRNMTFSFDNFYLLIYLLISVILLIFIYLKSDLRITT